MAKSISPAKVGPDDLQKVVAATIQKVDDVVKAQGSKFFPHGITKIAVSAKVTGIEVSVEVSGPDSSSGTKASGAPA